ncbi:SusC/RagA family TonB-linked outer membrane protein [Bacteroidales bacterium OttesenSCG-928-L03]|nr:SusC/RagA family TonB-linked outer membrane protein [Bacteroidales bacterium OttesenSCG-928-L03]
MKMKKNMKNSFHTIQYVISIIVFSLSSVVLLNAQDDKNRVEDRDELDKVNVLTVQLTAKNNNNRVEGLVRDAYTKEPINAAQISVPNKRSAITNEEGKFMLDLPVGDEVLHVTAFDYGKIEVPVQGNPYIVIDLYPEDFKNHYSDVLLPTGKVNNSSLTVSAKTKDNISQIIDVTADGIIETSLGGDVRTISRSGLVGMGNSMFIRGINSLNANAQPLFVVDGVVWNNFYDFKSIHAGLFMNPLEDIDVNDIESISVLKDGTSIYGSRAANGVVLITTKRARSMVTKIGLNVFYGVSETPATTPVMSSEDYRIYASDMLQSYGSSTTPGFLGSASNPKNNMYYNNTDWTDEIYQNGSVSNYIINVDGGDEKALYYFSIGYSGAEGVVKETGMNRMNARFNVDAKLANILTTKANVAFTRVEKNLMDDGVDYYSSPTWQAQIKAPFLTPYIFNTLGEKTQQLAYADELGIANPVGIIDYSQNKQKNYRFNIGVLPELTILPELVLSTQFDYALNKSDEAYFLPMSYSPERYLENKGTSKNKLMSQVMKNTTIFNDSRLTYDKLFGENEHSLKAMLGFRYELNNYEMDYIEEHNSGANTNTMITGNYQHQVYDGLNNTTKKISNYIAVDYDFNKKYFLSAAMSLDASSRFGKNTDSGLSMFGVSWGVFPSINGAWLFSSEKFMSPVEFINYGKLRVGYGVTGNDAIPDYEMMAYFSSVRFTGRANGLILSHFENEKVQWEQTGRANAGIDLGLFKDRVNLSFDVFSSKTNHLLTLKQLPEVLGTGYYWDNGGEMTNKGYELSFDLKALNLKDFQWELGFTLGHYKNEITSLVNPEGYFTTDAYGGQIISQVGQPAGMFYGYKTQGVFATEKEATLAGLKKENELGGYDYFSAGDVIFEDFHQDGIIDEKDKQIIGNPNPDFYGTINTNFNYKQFKLSALFTYSYGNDVYNYYRRMLESGTDFSNQSKAMLNRWTADGQKTNQPKAVYGDPMENSRFSDRWIEDGSFLKLKNVTLSYQVPYKNDYIRGINVWVSASNLFTLTDYLGRDPEVSAGNSPLTQGIDAGYLPASRTYYVGFRIDL